jgi:hypothetical protein
MFGFAEKSQYWSNQAKFIFFSTHYFRSRLLEITTFLHTVRALNSIIIGQKREELVVYSYNPFEEDEVKQFYKIDSDKDEMFPDKLKDLKRYRYRTISFLEYPNVVVKNGRKLTGIGIRFIEAIAKHQNALISNQLILVKNGQRKMVPHTFNKQTVDLSVNTDMMITGQNAELYRYVNTFETNGFCAILPYPERKSFFDYVMKPYDMWTWILIIASVTCFVIVWHLLNKNTPVSNPNTTWYFLFAFVSFFIGQGVEFREHRLMQKVLIQLMVLMTFILGNLYQSVLISLMSESRYGDQITLIQEMVDSKFTFMVDPVFMKMFSKSDQHQELNDKIKGTIQFISDLHFEKLAKENVGLILSCNKIDMLYHDTRKMYKRDTNAIDFYYRIKDKFYSFYQRFPTAPYSPFTERLQDYSLRIHESGIKQRWQTELNFEDMADVKQREYNAKEGFLLNLEDMVGAFYCLGIGCVLALMAFVLEIFYWDCIQRLEWNIITASIRRRFYSFSRRNRVATHRIIQVQPIV